MCTSCGKVGLSIHSPSTRPTRTADTGVSNGTLDIVSDTDAPMRARMSASFSWSAESMKARHLGSRA